MKKEHVIEYFDSQSEAARFLGISRAAVSKWPPVVPEASARRLEKMTQGRLEVDESLYPHGLSQ